MHTFGERLKYVRKLHRMTIHQLALQLDIYAHEVTSMEANERTPTFEEFINLNHIFGPSAELLVAGITGMPETWETEIMQGMAEHFNVDISDPKVKYEMLQILSHSWDDMTRQD